MDWTDLCRSVTGAMREHVAPYVATISRVLASDQGQLEGTGGYIWLRGSPYLLTNEHVARTQQTHSLAHHLAEDEYAVRITNPFQAESSPVDAALSRIDDIVWTGRNEKKAIPLERIAKIHAPIEHELLFMAGFSGERSYFSPGMTSLFSSATPFLTQEQEVPGQWQNPQTFALPYPGEKATSLDKRRLPDPHGFSGSLVWDTKAVACIQASRRWEPEYAQVTGLVWGWPPNEACLLATRIEYVRSFALRALRHQAAYFRWKDRGCPESDDLADWYSAEREIPDLA